MEGPAERVAARQWRREPEPRNGGGAKAYPLELAKE